jgi:hypothetical protein
MLSAVNKSPDIAVQLMKMAETRRQLSEQSMQFGEKNRERVSATVGGVIEAQLQIQQQKVQAGDVQLNGGKIGSIVDTTA